MRRTLSCVAWLALVGAAASSAQSVEVRPPQLGRLPTADVGSGRYWQQLVITLAQDDAASDSALTVTLPTRLSILDTDVDGEVADEIRVVYAPAGSELPGFFASRSTEARRIVVSSGQPAGAGGRLYLQYPVQVLPEVGGLSYGPVQFADDREQDLDGPVLNYVAKEEFAALGSMDLVGFTPAMAPGPDTTTAPTGAAFPDQPEVLMAPLPDLAFDEGVATSSNLLRFGNGNDGDDVQYRFYLSTDPSLAAVDSSVAVEATRLPGEPYRETEGEPHAVQLSTGGLAEGTYHLYVVSQLTGTIPLGRSRAVTVKHAPEVLWVAPQEADITLDSGMLYDRDGLPTGQSVQEVALGFAVHDFDDTATVSLFYSDRADLGSADLQLDQGRIAGLAGAAPLATDLRVPEASPSWDILHPTPVAAGAYFVYAAATDGRSTALGRSLYRVQVHHSPFLRLDPLDDRILAGADTIVTGGSRPQRAVTITWGRSGYDGDLDVDDNARIDLYCSGVPAAAGTEPGYAVPGDGSDLLADVGATAFAIATGLSEDPDGREDNLYVWDLLEQARGGRPVPEAGMVYYIYGIVADSTVRRLVQMNGGRLNDAGSRLVFAHGPGLQPLQPLAETTLRPGHSARVSWEGGDLGGPVQVRVLLTRSDRGSLSDYTSVATAGAYVANSADGAPNPAADPARDLAGDGYLDLRLEPLIRGLGGLGPVQSGLYYVYIAATGDGSFGSSSLAWRAPGRVQVDGAGGNAGGALHVFQLLPEEFSLGAGQHQGFEVRVDAGVASADLVMFTLAVDRKAFAVVDKDPVLDGIQPFAVGPGFAAAKVVTNAAEAGADSVYLRFAYLDPIVPAVPLLDGEHPVATFELVALEQPGVAGLFLANDPAAQHGSRLENDGQVVLSPESGALAHGVLLPGGATLKGRLALEGRVDQTARVDVSLRRWASYEPMADTAFAAANDVDPELPGVQVQTGADGGFELRRVPAARMDLYVHLDGYLDGWAPALDLLPSQTVEGLRPSSTGQPADTLMLGGDVAGYLDTDGGSRPDNEVTLADWDFAAAWFGAGPDTSGGGRQADITGDGVVDIRDLALIGANFLRQGPQPVYKPRAGTEEPVLRWRCRPEAPQAGQEAVLEVTGEGTAGVRAWEMELRYDPARWAVVSGEPWPGAGPVLTADRRQPGSRRMAASLQGRGSRFGDAPYLVRWRLRALTDGAETPVIEAGPMLDQADRPVRVRALYDLADRPVPQACALTQNYPNPFNPRTTIGFSVPPRPGAAQGQVRLEVFDALGQRAAVLWEGPLSPGEYRVAWDGRDQEGRPVASGVYVYRLECGSDRLLKRMSLVK